jgi:hypothetical protein
VRWWARQPYRRGVGQGTPGPGMRVAAGDGCDYGASGGGAPAPGSARSSAGYGPWVVTVGHPASHRPRRAEQTTARRASVRTCVNVRLTWRTGRRPAPTAGGSTAHGMARGQGCWLSRSRTRKKPGQPSPTANPHVQRLLYPDTWPVRNVSCQSSSVVSFNFSSQTNR